MRITADRPGKISFRATLSRPEHAKVVVRDEHDLLMSGQLDNDGQPGMKYAARMRIIASGGSISREDVVGSDVGVGGGAGGAVACRVRGADSVVILFAACTDYDDYTFHRTVANRIDSAAAHSCDALLKRHFGDHHDLFNRVKLDLGRSKSSALPTDQRLVAFADGGDDPALHRALLPSRPVPADVVTPHKAVYRRTSRASGLRASPTRGTATTTRTSTCR